MEEIAIGAFCFLVLALACGRTLQSLNFAGIIGIMDPPRPGARESIETVRLAGVQVKMITGDAIETAQSIGINLWMHLKYANL